MKSASKTFWARYRGLVGPEHAGAGQPPFEPLGFNESRIDRELRAKRVDVSVEGGRAAVEWVSEGWTDDPAAHRALAEEVWRCLAACGVRGPASLSARSRHGHGPVKSETADVGRVAREKGGTIGA